MVFRVLWDIKTIPNLLNILAGNQWNQDLAVRRLCSEGLEALAFLENFGEFDNFERLVFRVPLCLNYGEIYSVILGQSKWTWIFVQKI